MSSILTEDFLKKLSDTNKSYQEDEKFLMWAKALIVEPQNCVFKEQSIEKTINVVSNILMQIAPEYSMTFLKMLDEEREDKPIIYIFNSNSPLEENESITYKNEVFFYKTNTTADVYLLLHEFSHFLININNNYSSNKRNNEIAPILIEFIVYIYHGDENFIHHRQNLISKEAKSILIKHEILNGNFDLETLYREYQMSEKEIQDFETDLLYSKKLTYEEEINYINGYVYALYYSKDEHEIITNYIKLVKELSNNRNQKLEDINLESVISSPRRLLRKP